LVTLLADPQDPGYAEAAARRAEHRHVGESSAGRSVRAAMLGWTMLGVVVIGLLLGVAVRNTEANAPSADSARQGLIADIDRAQARASDLESSVAGLATEIRERQATLGAGPAGTLDAAAIDSGTQAVTGPGLTVTLDNPDGAGNDVILDRDIQALVNGLWASGAEAVAVGDVRLQPTSAIRKAGGAILVDNRPVFWPITITAIGNPATLPADFAGTAGYGRFASLASLYSIRFDVATSNDLNLPAGPEPVLRYASPAATAVDSSTARPRPTKSGSTTAPPTPSRSGSTGTR
jgi:uncharacterized protein YlxW (UPF0749 family)